MPPKKKKKIDYEALRSSHMKIPQMKVDIARGLLDIGIKESFELTGRAPEVILQEMLGKQPALQTIPDIKERVSLAIYFVENEEHEPHKLKLSYWSSL